MTTKDQTNAQPAGDRAELLLKEMRYIAGISTGQVKRVAEAALKNAADDKAHVGESAFEGWYSTYSPAHKSDKQRARDAYAAGMADDKAGGEVATIHVDGSFVHVEWRGEAPNECHMPVYTSPQPQTIPAGYALVPVEPTPEIFAAMWAYKTGELSRLYSAILEAGSKTEKEPG